MMFVNSRVMTLAGISKTDISEFMMVTILEEASKAGSSVGIEVLEMLSICRIGRSAKKPRFLTL